MRTAIKAYESIYEVDESGDATHAIKESYFFQKTKERQRETFTKYRGCIIAAYTETSTGLSARRYEPCLICYKEGITFCLSTECKNIGQAKQMIDAVLKSGIAK